MKSYRTHSLASFDVSPTHPLPSLSSSEISSQPVASSSCLPITPTAPRRRRLYSSGLDETPSKRIRIMTSEIAATSSGSFLVSKDPYTSSTPFPRMLERQPLDLPAPDWHLLVPPTSYKTRSQLEEDNRKLVASLTNAKGYIAAFADREETLEAQMVIQDMTLVKMKAALHAKETKKAEKNDNEVLLNDGMGRLWTDARILEYQQKKRAEKEQEAAEKEQRKQQRSSKKALKTTIESEWAAIKKKHEEDLEKWGRLCTELKGKGAKAKDLPKKPSHETKKSLVARLSGNDSGESGHSGSETEEE
ncbi:hypothetical protein FB446DRAFT_650743 [Lentinula raphanica]|nr:hypothetical protein FB446DRAFT_650743 [Lentinula raphanica]